MKTYTLEDIKRMAKEFIALQSSEPDSSYRSAREEADDVLDRFIDHIQPYQPQGPYRTNDDLVVDVNGQVIAQAGSPELAAALVAAANKEPAP